MNANEAARITRSTVSLWISLLAPVAIAAVVGYQVRQHEARLVDHEARIRDLEERRGRIERLENQVGNLTEENSELRQQVRDLTRQIDRLR